ncbi:unnamed protein product, partial [Ectocarpus sp. 12 AP-2014]
QQHSGSKEDYSSLGGSTAWRAARTVEGGRACRYSEADALILLSPARNIDILAGQAWEVISLGKRTEESRPSKSPTTAVLTSACIFQFNDNNRPPSISRDTSPAIAATSHCTGDWHHASRGGAGASTRAE